MTPLRRVSGPASVSPLKVSSGHLAPLGTSISSKLFVSDGSSDIFDSGQNIEGIEGLPADVAERLKAENPMLQQKMKPRHLVMIAVGMCG
jgi:hypothetical protein